MTRSSLSKALPGSKLAKLSLFLLMATMVGCDHATKHAAETMLSSRPPLQLLPGVLDLRYAQNHDTAFSVLARFGVHGASPYLAVLASLVLVGLGVFWAMRAKEASRVEHVGFALAMAGAVGNVADRIFRGFVVDFIHVERWPVFNVADIAVAVGAALIVYASMRQKPSSAPPPPTEAPL